MGIRASYVLDSEGNLIEIESWGKEKGDLIVQITKIKLSVIFQNTQVRV